MARLRTLQELERRIARLEQQVARLTPIANKSDELGAYFPTGVGKMTQRQAQKRQATHDRQRQVFQQLQEAERSLKLLRQRREAVVRGEVHLNGQPRADAPSRQKRADALQVYADYVRAHVHPGDMVEFLEGNDKTAVVTRLNKKTVTLDGGERWDYATIRPLRNGQTMTDAEFCQDLRAWGQRGTA
ncbi:MAG: hypothetical protein IAE79_07625 [Anaerolinea sp.]|nr:hypothetical protein [Anaerolinea sp.]